MWDFPLAGVKRIAGPRGFRCRGSQGGAAEGFPHSFVTRAIYSTLLVALVVIVGTVGMHSLEGMSYLDAFYFTSMLATGQGPNYTPATEGGKIFAALMAFISVGTVITALIFLFGPFFGRVFRVGAERIEEIEREHEHKSEEKRG